MRKLLLALAAVAACTSNPTASQFPTDLLTAACDYAVKCQLMPDVATCKSTTTAAYWLGLDDMELQTVLDDITAKKITYNGAAASGCINAIESAGIFAGSLLNAPNCVFDGLYPSAAAECNMIWTGLAGSGSACFYSEECASGFTCTSSTGSGCDPTMMCCAGTCTALPAVSQVGQACADSTQCVAGTYCSMMTNTCKTIATSFDAECEGVDGCADPMICKIDLNCSPTSTPCMGNCINPAAHGTTCDPTVTYSACADTRDYCNPVSMLCTSAAGTGSACGAQPTYAPCIGADVCSQGSATAMTCVPIPSKVGDACPDGLCLGSLQCGTGSAATCMVSTSGSGSACE